MIYQKIYQCTDGPRVKTEPALEIDSFDNEVFQWSYIGYHAAPGQEKFEDVTTKHLQGQATVGCRRQTVQKVAYTLGGLEDPTLLDAITSCIQQNQAFAGQAAKYIKCASKCFHDGSLRPLTQNTLIAP